MNAIKLSRILMVSILGMLVLIGFGFMQLSDLFAQKVKETVHARIDAQIAEDDVRKLENLEAQLNEQAEVVERAKEIVAQGKSYKYQDQIVADLTAYANRSGVVISGFNFSTSTTTAKPKAGTAKPAGTKISTTINLQSPLRYDSLIKFVRLIEGNLTKMQIANLSISPEGKNPSLVNNPSISLEMYITQ